MPDNPPKTPIPAVMNVAEFMERFGSQEACAEHLRTVRWGRNLERFTCPACGHPKGWSLHTFVANLKRMILGTYHSVSPKHLDSYLAEFSYRANRRWLEANLFDRLINTAVVSKAVTYRELVTGVS